MAIDTVDALLEALLEARLLDEAEVEQLRQMQDGFESPRALAKYLVQLDWLTVYQINQLFEGAGRELVVGPYVVLDRLGEGGVGTVFKAWDTRKGRVVALKVLRQHLDSDRSTAEQFLRESQAITRLNHPNVIKTYDAGQRGSTYWFAMEFVEGTDLAKVVQLSGPLPIREACDYVRQVAAGLQHAHQLGLVHRDIKPANLFLIHPPGQDGLLRKRPAEPVIKILDWGLARIQPAEGERSEPTSVGSERGLLIGTADYIAPEQAQDPRLVDVRADVYSLGCTFYYLLTGRPPFPGASLMQKILQHQKEEPTPIRTIRPEIPEELESVVRKMIAKRPDDRFQIPLAVSVGLRKFCEDSGVRPSLNGAGSRPLVPSNGFSGRKL